MFSGILTCWKLRAGSICNYTQRASGYAFVQTTESLHTSFITSSPRSSGHDQSVHLASIRWSTSSLHMSTCTLTPVSVMPGPSNNNTSESVLNPPFTFMMADKWVSGNFEVGSVRNYLNLKSFYQVCLITLYVIKIQNRAKGARPRFAGLRPAPAKVCLGIQFVSFRHWWFVELWWYFRDVVTEHPSLKDKIQTVAASSVSAMFARRDSGQWHYRNESKHSTLWCS